MDCVVETVFLYALGRGMEAKDRCNVEAVTENFKKRGASFEALINSITESPAFTMRRGETGDQ